MTKKDGSWRLIAIVVLLAALACGCADGEPAVDDAVDHGGSLVSKEGQIAFTRANKFDWTDWTFSESDIYASNVDGSEERRLTDSPGLDGFPAWSPDGERLAFVSARDGGNSEIYVMNADGSGQRRLTHTSRSEFFLAWSPDGDRIVYTAYDSGLNATLWVMDAADGSEREQLASGALPSWSPDGERIVYTAYFGERPYLAVMNADGSERRGLGDVSLIRKITGTAEMYEEPAWSPDGKRIAFASEDNGEIYVMNADGSGRTRLTDIPKRYDHWPPTWSPDGKRIAFSSEDKKGSEIYIMNSDGSGLTNLTDTPADDFYPAWRP